jgi:hypothetical protein
MKKSGETDDTPAFYPHDFTTGLPSNKNFFQTIAIKISDKWESGCR